MTRSAISKQWKSWSAQESAIAAEIWQKTVTDIYGDDEWTDGVKTRAYQVIARKLGRTAASVAARFVQCGPSFVHVRQSNMNIVGGMRASPKALADREAYRAALDARDLTASLMGDTPKGFSALDRRSAR